MTYEFPIWHSWEGPKTATAAYGTWRKPAHTVHFVNNFSFNYPPTLVTSCCDPDQGKAKEDIFEQPHVPDMITGPPHTHAGTSPTAVALLSAREFVEPKSY
jgi:hypothetical protein